MPRANAGCSYLGSRSREFVERLDLSRALRSLLAAVLGSVAPLVVITLDWRLGTGVETPLDATLAVVVISYPLWLRPLGIERTHNFVGILVGFSAVLGAVSYLTGGANGLTDEAYTTPLYAGILLHGQNFYSVPLVVVYTQYGVHSTVSTFYSYLPLLTFLQIPYLDYKVFSALCWLGIVWLVRKDFYAAAALAQPFVGLMAFNGFNDFAPLLLLTVAFVGWEGRRQKWAQLVALGTKQFANVIVLLYHLARRDWGNALLVAAVTAAFLLPFLIWNAPATLCQAVLYGVPSGCSGNGHLLLFHIDYGLWPLWCAAVFYAPFRTFLRSHPVHRIRSWALGRRDRETARPR
jgi:hypothetical protein